MSADNESFLVQNEPCDFCKASVSPKHKILFMFDSDEFPEFVNCPKCGKVVKYNIYIRDCCKTRYYMCPNCSVQIKV